MATICTHLKHHQTYEVSCARCGELRWPYLPEKPAIYTCSRCVSGVGAARREAGRRLRPKGSPPLGGKR